MNEIARTAELAALYARLAEKEAALAVALADPNGDLGTLEDDLCDIRSEIADLEEEDAEEERAEQRSFEAWARWARA